MGSNTNTDVMMTMGRNNKKHQQQSQTKRARNASKGTN
jgi:hypothetical protein